MQNKKLKTCNCRPGTCARGVWAWCSDRAANDALMGWVECVDRHESPHGWESAYSAIPLWMKISTRNNQRGDSRLQRVSRCNICHVRGQLSGVPPQPISDAIASDGGEPSSPALIEPSPEQASSGSMQTVARVFCNRCNAQVLDTVITANGVNVIDHPLGPFSINVEPSQPVSQYLKLVNLHNYISNTRRTRDQAWQMLAALNITNEDARFRVVADQLFDPLNGGKFSGLLHSSHLLVRLGQFSFSALNGHEEVAQSFPFDGAEIRALTVSDLAKRVETEGLHVSRKTFIHQRGNRLPPWRTGVFQLTLEVVDD